MCCSSINGYVSVSVHRPVRSVCPYCFLKLATRFCHRFESVFLYLTSGTHSTIKGFMSNVTCFRPLAQLCSLHFLFVLFEKRTCFSSFCKKAVTYSKQTQVKIYNTFTKWKVQNIVQSLSQGSTHTQTHTHERSRLLCMPYILDKDTMLSMDAQRGFLQAERRTEETSSLQHGALMTLFEKRGA